MEEVVVGVVSASDNEGKGLLPRRMENEEAGGLGGWSGAEEQIKRRSPPSPALTEAAAPAAALSPPTRPTPPSHPAAGAMDPSELLRLIYLKSRSVVRAAADTKPASVASGAAC